MPGTPTTKYAIPTLAGSDLARDIDTNVNAGFAAVDSKMVGYSAGLLSARPTSTGGSPGIAGRRYRATDTGQEFIDTGTNWIDLGQYAEGTLAARPVAGLRGRIYRATDTGQVFQDTGASWSELAQAPVADASLSSPNNPVPRVAFQASAFIPGGAGVDTYLFPGGSTMALSSTATSHYLCPVWVPNLTDFAVAGKTTQARIVAHMVVNAVAPGVSFVVNVNGITIVGGSGSSSMTFALGGGLPTNATFTTPAAGSKTRAVSSWAALSLLTAGAYCLVVAPSGTIAANSLVTVSAAVEMRHA